MVNFDIFAIEKTRIAAAIRPKSLQSVQKYPKSGKVSLLHFFVILFPFRPNKCIFTIEIRRNFRCI